MLSFLNPALEDFFFFFFKEQRLLWVQWEWLNPDSPLVSSSPGDSCHREWEPSIARVNLVGKLLCWVPRVAHPFHTCICCHILKLYFITFDKRQRLWCHRPLFYRQNWREALLGCVYGLSILEIKVGFSTWIFFFNWGENPPKTKTKHKSNNEPFSFLV